MDRITDRLLSWASVLEDRTRQQAEQTSRLPFVFPHVALMPDAHLGLGATVGSVIPTERALVPAAVGVDIGCGMEAVRTQLTADDLRAHGSLAPLREAVERAVPLSAGVANDVETPSATGRNDTLAERAAASGVEPDGYLGRWRLQTGTLGSGNHFIEVCLDESDRVWVFLHSGSRGVGNQIAQRHVKVAQRLAERWFLDLPHRDLAYLVEDTDEFWAYVRALLWAQDYARANRAEMVDRVVTCLVEFVGVDVERVEEVSCHHNYTRREHHVGRDVWVSRKGAISAAVGEPGLVPGSMGTRSYVVEGLGNPVALHSAPHGAGRAMSRTKARQAFTLEQLDDAMEGVEFRRTSAFLDEHPGAYKDVDVVMRDAADLVRVVHTLRQVVNVKGD